MAKSVVVLNGPNLNMLGNREQEIYGSETLSDIEKNCQLKATSMKLALEFRQTNSEGEWCFIVVEAFLKFILMFFKLFEALHFCHRRDVSG